MEEIDVSDDGAVAACNENCADFFQGCCTVGDGVKENANFCADDSVDSVRENFDVNVYGVVSVENENTSIDEDYVLEVEKV